MATTPPWKRKNPKSKHKKLSAEDTARARARAHRAGRRYPNLVDNMWAASGKKTAKKKSTAKKSAAKKSTAKKSTAKKSTAKKSTKRRTTKKRSAK